MLPIVTDQKMASSKTSYVSDLTCSGCGRVFSVHDILTYCPDCQSPILVNYDLAEARRFVDRSEIHARLKGMWRWHELLPVLDPLNMVSLGEERYRPAQASAPGKIARTGEFIRKG